MKSGDVVLMKFPFSDLETTKKRPALILQSIPIGKSYLLVIAMITSKTEGIKLDGDVLLQDWTVAHLLHPSLLRLGKIATADAELIDKKLGTLSKRDRLSVSKTFQKLFHEWF